MLQIDLFCKDLILKSKVKEIAIQNGAEVRNFRSVCGYQSKALIVGDLIVVNANDYHEQFAQFQELQQTSNKTYKIISFVAHVDKEIIAKAHACGIFEIEPRSSFFNTLVDKIRLHLNN